MSIATIVGSCALLTALDPGGAVPSGVYLRHFGHAAFGLSTTQGVRAVIDPYQNSPWSFWFTRPFPSLSSDVVISTHGHFDHAAKDSIGGRPRVLDGPGRTHVGDLSIVGFTGLHARPERYGSENNVFLFEADGIRIVDWGDNGTILDTSELGGVDVLILPVDESEHLLRFEEVAAIVDRLSPAVVIPSHYFEMGLTSPCSTLGPLDRRVESLGVIRRISADGVVLRRGALPTSREVWVFEPTLSDEALSPMLDWLPCLVRPWGARLLAVAGFSLISTVAFTVLRVLIRGRRRPAP